MQSLRNLDLPQLKIRPGIGQVFDTHADARLRVVGRYNEFALFQESRH
jgi:hypothetical protein